MSDRALAVSLGVSFAGLVAAVFAMGYLAGMSSLRRRILETQKARRLDRFMKENQPILERLRRGA